MKKQQYIVLRSFLSAEEEKSIVDEVLSCHRMNSGEDLVVDANRQNSLKLDLGIGCGGDVSSRLKTSTSQARRAFKQASTLLPTTTQAFERFCLPTTRITGLSLIYSLDSFMSPHYDSPTQAGQREEWLCMFTFGLPCLFQLDDRTVQLNSGDAVVMDSMATLHGVDSIVDLKDGDNQCKRIGLPSKCRLGVLFWVGRNSDHTETDYRNVPVVDGLESMFGDEMTDN
jgi:hypothetical protein